MEKCYCGKPLHYEDPAQERYVKKIVSELGEFISVKVVGQGTFLVPRHYIALHGIKGADLGKLGFKQTK